MGLLDEFGSFAKTPEGVGLLSGIAGLLAGARRGAPLNSIGIGAMAGLNAFSGAIDRQDQLQNSDIKRKLEQAQLDAIQRKLATQKVLGDALKTAGTSQPQDSGMSPSTYQAFGLSAPPVSTAPQVSYADTILSAARQAGDAEAFQEGLKLKLEEKKAAEKFATTPQVVMKNGVPTLVQMSDSGTVREMPGMSPAEKLHFADNGSTIQGLNPYTGLPVGGGIKKTMTPDAVASNALGWANYNKPTTQNIEGVGLVQVNNKGQASPVMMGGKPVIQDKPLTEGQGTAALFGSRMADAHNTLNELAKQGVYRQGSIKQSAESMPLIGGKLATATNWTQSDAQQQVENAKINFLTAVLRKESGASISPTEFESADKVYFPVFGDSDKIIEQKRRNREMAIQGMSRMAGPAGNFSTGSSDLADAASKELERRKKGGK